MTPQFVSLSTEPTSFTPLELAIREQHFVGHLPQASISVDGYNNQHGLMMTPIQKPHEFASQDIVTTDQVDAARRSAAIAYASGKADRVIITINDSERVAVNDRNAPIDGQAGPYNPDDKLINHIYPKVKTGDPGNDVYNWKQLDQDTLTQLMATAVIFTLTHEGKSTTSRTGNSEKPGRQRIIKRKSARRKKIDTRKRNKKNR